MEESDESSLHEGPKPEADDSKSSPHEDLKPQSVDVAKSSLHEQGRKPKSDDHDSYKPSPCEDDPGPELDEVPRFDKSLNELRNLRAQLHYAADYCETAFLKSKEKKLVLENTKEYICKAMITVIDHLGSVSTNLECLVNGCDEVSQTELLMDGLQHRLLASKQYTHELGLSQVRWMATLPRYHPCYSAKLIKPKERSNGAMPFSNLEDRQLQRDFYLSRDNIELTKAESKHRRKEADGEVPFNIKRVNTHLTPEFEFSPASDGPSILSKPRTPSFGSQTQDSPRFRYKNLINIRHKKSEHSNIFLPFLRRSKKAT